MAKVTCTNRIRIDKDKVIYCSGEVIKEVRSMITKLNQFWHPLKGEMFGLQGTLVRLARQERFEDHFPKSSHRILEDIGE